MNNTKIHAYIEKLKAKPADHITLCRMLLSVVLLFLPPVSVPFFLVYLLCGLSDIADGITARKTHTESEAGAKLDGAADLLFLAVSAVKILPLLRLAAWIWAWAAGIAILKASAMLLRFRRRHTVLPPHSFANKLTGLALFLLPLTLPYLDIRFSAAFVCAVASCAAVQDIAEIGK